MHLLQVCNVGKICGGTAACAWTISQAFPDCEHTVLFLSSISRATREAFRLCQIRQVTIVDSVIVREINPDVIVLHNTHAARCGDLSNFFTIQYHHSSGERAISDLSLSCSKWLANQLPGQVPVLHQAVPQPCQPSICNSRQLADELVIGRLCTPQARKWPRDLIEVYDRLSKKHPQVHWEFVGAPASMQSDLHHACRQRAEFYQASFDARKRFWNWHALLYHHPSLSESYGRTVAESMRAGCVPIVDARGGFCEQITDQQTGFLCKTQADFSDAITRLSDISRWHQVSKDASRSANDFSSLATMRKQLLHIFKHGSPIESVEATAWQQLPALAGE